MRPVSATLIACALIPLSLAMSACEPHTVTDSSRHIYCEVMPDAPQRNTDNSPTRVLGKVRFRCDRPGAATMTLNINLQRQNKAGDWINVAGNSFTVSGEQTVGTQDETFRTREISAACSAGTFRMYVKGSSSARGATKTYDRPGPKAFNPCQPSFFA